MLKSILKTSAIASVAALGMAATSASAGVVGFGPNSSTLVDGCADVQFTCSVVSGAGIPDPVALNPNNNELLVWQEVEALTLASDLTVDEAIGGGTIIGSGTTLTSFMVQFDSPGSDRGTMEASITFDTEILGFITLSDTLDDTDALLGIPGLSYASATNRGLEIGQDTAVLGADAFSVDISFTVTTPGDWIRVLVAAEPRPVSEPASLALLGTALLGFGMARRRTARK